MDSKVLVFVDQYWSINHYAPTVQEIANELSLSKSATLYIMRRLRAKGLLLYEDCVPRTVRTSEMDKILQGVL